MIITLILKLYARQDVESRVFLSKRGSEIERRTMTGDLLVLRTMQWFPVKTKSVGVEVTYKS